MSSASDTLQIGPAPRERRSEALRLVFHHLGDADCAMLTANLLADSADGAASLAGLLEARRGGRLVGAVWAQVQPGATAIVWPPGVVDGEEDETAAALMSAATQFIVEKQVCMAQTLLSSADDPAVATFTAAGFAHLADLNYLVSVESTFPTTCPREALDFETYTEENHARLADVVERTYEATQDCPQLNNVRKMEDVLAGYRATGVFDPRRWLLVGRGGRDVGCLLLADHPGADQWELVYMGIVPDARGSSLGREIVRYAQWLVRRAQRPRLVLAVDARNDPAIAAYTACGFVHWDRRSVFLRVFS